MPDIRTCRQKGSFVVILLLHDLRALRGFKRASCASWFQLWRPLSVSDRAGERNIRQLEFCRDAAEHQSTSAHVAAADEIGREHQALAEDRQEEVHVLSRRDAAEQYDLAVRTN